MTGTPITILMGLYNGAEHLAPQLQSFADQDDPDWRLLVSDDGSCDGGAEMVAAFGTAVPQDVQIIDGPQRGFAANYMAMIAGLESEPGLIAFADQDDVWLSDKLARARGHLALLAETEPDIPALYCARRWVWQAETDRRQATPLPRRAPSFRNALIENIAPGNTVVLNPAAARLARAAARRTGDVFAHDWWLYLLITGAGRRVIVDKGPPCLLYRQHGGNAIGGKTGAAAQIKRKMKVLQGAFRDRLAGNLAAMREVEDLLTPQNAQLMRAFTTARAETLAYRLRGLARIAPYRQTSLGTLGFWGAALLGRV